jgi:hypothetical protein
MSLDHLNKIPRDRKISIALALVIGLILGAGIWLMMKRGEPESVPQNTTSTSSVVATSSDSAPLPIPALHAHKALYDIKLTTARNGSQIVNIAGKMFYQLQKGCDGWITDHRFTLDYEYADAAPMRIASDFSTVESLDGSSLNFTSRRRRDGELYQELRGEASVDAKGVGSAIYDEPDNASFEFDGGVMFPNQHTVKLLQAARAGKKFMSATVFDGTDEEGPVDITALIGPAIDEPLKLLMNNVTDQVTRDLLKSRAWKIRLAFFPQNASGETSDYELSMMLHENGVISDMTIDYQDFSVAQRLVALDPVNHDECMSTPNSAEKH